MSLTENEPSVLREKSTIVRQICVSNLSKKKRPVSCARGGGKRLKLGSRMRKKRKQESRKKEGREEEEVEKKKAS